jgi:hypothetical protein
MINAITKLLFINLFGRFFSIIIALICIWPSPGSGGIRITLSIEKKKYLLDERLFMDVDLQAQGPDTSYFQPSSDIPPIEIRDSNGRLIPVGELHADYAFPVQTIMGKHGRGFIEGEKLVPGEPYYLISSYPPSLSREKFKPGPYKVRYHLLEYDPSKENFKYGYSEWANFEIVEPSGTDARVDSLLVNVHSLIKQIEYTKARSRLKVLFNKYPESAYVGSIAWEMGGLLPRNQAEEVMLKDIERHPNSMAASHEVAMLILYWSPNEYDPLSISTDHRKKIDALAANYKGTRVEQTIKRQLLMAKRGVKR